MTTPDPTDGTDRAARTVELLRALDDFASTQRDIGNRMAASLRLHRSSLTVLRLLERNGPTSLKDLACALRVDLSVASRHVATLVDVGLIDRTVHPDDRRVRMMALTDAGHASVARTSAAGARIVAASFGTWSDDDIENAVDMVGRVTHALQESISDENH